MADSNYVDQATWERWEADRLAKNRAFDAQCASERARPRVTREDMLAQIHALRVHNSQLDHQLHDMQAELDAKCEELRAVNRMLNELVQEAVAKRERPPLRIAA
jgi:septal ring factor EnvC (AmiA/AmiB activator)